MLCPPCGKSLQFIFRILIIVDVFVEIVSALQDFLYHFVYKDDCV